MKWLRFQFGSRQDLENTVLLLLDDFSGHWTQEIVEYAEMINVTLLKVPPNATSVSQPADSTWNGPIKTRLRNAWIQNLREQLAARVPGLPFKLKPPDHALLCEWVAAAWRCVSASTIRAGFHHCGLVQRDEDVSYTYEQVEAQADDQAMLHSNLIDTSVQQFSLEDDFDALFRAMAQVNQ